MKRYAVLGILALFIMSFIATTVLIIFTPTDESEEERVFVDTVTINELFENLEDGNGSFADYNEGDWLLVEEMIVSVKSEEAHLAPGKDAYVKIGDNRYDHVYFVWVESMGEADFNFNFSIGAKKKEQLSILRVGEPLTLELKITEGLFKGNVRGHRELVYDPSGLTIV
jgi:hypothetical protein